MCACHTTENCIASITPTHQTFLPLCAPHLLSIHAMYSWLCICRLLHVCNQAQVMEQGHQLVCLINHAQQRKPLFLSCVDAESPRIIHLYNTEYYTYYCIIHNTQDFPLYYCSLSRSLLARRHAGDEERDWRRQLGFPTRFG